MKKNIDGEVVYYTFEHFEKTGLVKHGFSTKLGGVSGGNLSSMNLGFSRGDDRQNVVRNYEILCKCLDIDTNNLVLSWQTHTTNVRKVTKADCGNGFLRGNEFKDIDGLVTCDYETAIVTFYADCVPVFFLDPIRKAIGISHAGWRGTLNKIAENTVNMMKAEFGCAPSDILVGIGPSIGGCCFEVDEPVYSLFEQKSYAKKHIEKTKEDKRNINLWEVNKEILLGCGVLEKNIETAGICTKCESDVFYSNRVMGDKRGSLAAIMELKNEK